MQTFSKKFLAILLTLCMLASFVPFGAFAAEANAEVVGRQLMLGDDLSMHFYTKVENASNATATISVGGIKRETYSLSKLTAGENGYDLSVHLAAAEMTDKIILTVNDGASNILTDTYTVRDYAHYLIENNYTDETKALTKELLNYGAKAQLYFGHKTGDLANATYSIETEAVLPEAAPTVEVSDNLSGMDFYGASMVFESKIAVRFYFAAENGADGFTFAVDGKTYGTQWKNGRHYIEVADINPDQMDTLLNISVTKGEESLNFRYSPMSYITRMYNKASSSQALKDMLLAATGYFEAAKVFTGVAENRTGSLSLACRYGTNNLIQVNTNLPSDTPLKDFLTTDNGCNIDQSANTVQWVGSISMHNVEGTIVLGLHFNQAFEAGQTYVLPKGAVFGFTDNSKYTLDKNYTFTFDGASWSMEAKEEPIALAYRYGTNNLIQYNTNLPVTTPLVNFLAADNGCDLKESANQYQWVGSISMHNVDGTIVLGFHFNNPFEVGQNYIIPAGAVFGFTDGNKYELTQDINLYWDGSGWTTEEPDTSIELTYHYGNASTIQFHTNLPETTPCENFLTTDNGSNIDESANQYHNVSWIAMENVGGTIVLSFTFYNKSFEVGQNYIIPAGAVFGFKDGNKYELAEEINLYWDGAKWDSTAPITLEYRYGLAGSIMYNTNLPETAKSENFLSSKEGCAIIQSGNQQVGWFSMGIDENGVVYMSANFNSAFTYGQSYTLSAGSVFTFDDGSSYKLYKDVTLYWNGAAWAAEEPVDLLGAENFTGGEVITFADVPADFTNSEKIEEYKGLGFNTSLVTEDHIGGYGEGADNYYNVSVATPEVPNILNLQYHYGVNNLIQIKTNLPTDVPTVNFTTSDNGCNVLQSGAQNVGWIQMNGLVGDVQLLTFHFNNPFEAGQSYTLSKGSVFGFADGSSYVLGGDYTFTWDGSNWSMTAPEGAPATVTPTMDKLNMQYRYGESNKIQVNTNLPASTPIANFLAGDNGCNILQNGDQQFGWAGMVLAEDGYVTITFNFNAGFTAGQSYTLSKGSVFGFADGSKYVLDSDYTFTWDGANWSMSTSTLSFSVNYANGNTIQLKTNIPTGLTYGNFLLNEAADKGHNLLLETNAQEVGWFGFSADANTNAVYFTLNFNSYNKPGAQYILKAGTSLKAGDRIFTTDRDYILTVNNAYLSSIENLDNAGLDVWVRNFTNKTGYFDDAMTKALLLYKDTIDGFYMVDEAFQNNALLVKAGQESITTDFDALSADVVGWFNTNFAGKYFHSNHVPISSFDHYGDALTAANADAYRQFLEIYKDKFNEMVDASGSSIGFDNYPFVREQTVLNSGIYKDYLLNALIAAQVAGNYDLSVCVQTFEASGKMEFMGFNTSRDITSAAEVSLQLYTGFAMGADVFEYFAYNATADFKAIMNQDGTKRIYDIVKEGNEALCFADVVNSFTWDGIVTSTGTKNSANGNAFDSVASMVLTNASNGVLNSYSSTDDAIIGCFTKDSLNGYMIVNFNDPKAVTGDNTVSVSFENCARARVYTEVDGVLTSQIVDLTNGSYTVTLAPGSGCFVIPA